MGDEIAAAAGGRGHLRASHTDRERVIDALKAAFVQGQLDKDEMDARVGHAFTSRTYAELAALTADIPAAPAASRPPRRPARIQGRARVHASIKTGVCAIVAAALLTSSLKGMTWPETAMTVVFALVFGAIVGGIVALPIAGFLMLESRHRKRSGRQLPPRSTPGVSGQASRHPASAASDGQFPQVDPGQQHTAEAARSDHAGLQSSSSRPLDRWRARGRCYAIGYVGH